MLRLRHDSDDTLSVHFGHRQLLSYVYQADTPQIESPRPYFHPVSTLGGDLVTLFRPDDHIWHRGIAWSLPNVDSASDSANFWGGVTYKRDTGYIQLPNNGAMRHVQFLRTTASASGVTVAHRLHWITEPGETWFREVRRFAVTVVPSHQAWVLAFSTALTNISGRAIAIGSPTTEGRDNAGYGGLFWRGPEPFVGGKVYTPKECGGDELMNVREPWMGFAGARSTLVFVDAPDNIGHPTQWFVRTQPYACLCPAPFFSSEVPVAPDESLYLRYAIVFADGDPGSEGVAKLAEIGQSALSEFPD